MPLKSGLQKKVHKVMKAYDTTHQFAFYSNSVKDICCQPRVDVYHITESELVYRLTSVLRIERGDRIILFDSSHHISATIVQADAKKSVAIQIHEIAANKQLTPTIQWLLPLLKREAFEEALYTLTELGVQSIQPLLTQKTIRFFGGDREISRCQKILKAAAEQSKQFILPLLQPIIPLDIWLMKSVPPSTTKIFFDPSGLPLKEVLGLIERQKSAEIIACAGPEGDLTYEEKLKLNDQGFIFCALTPTILRAQQAVAVGLGSLRSLLS